MKKLMLLALSAMMLASCGPEKYTITGRGGESMEGSKVLLRSANNETISDSCIVTDGEFSFTGTTDGQAMCIIDVEDSPIGRVFLQNGVNVSVDLSQKPASVSDNGGLNDIYVKVKENIEQAAKNANDTWKRLMAAGLSQTDPEFRDTLGQAFDAYWNVIKEGINANKDNYVGASLMADAAATLYPDMATLDSAIAEVKYAHEFAQVNALRASYEKAEKTSAGKMFVDFTGKTVDGNASKLSDYVGHGKYVLVDFWASWCGPCRAEIPNLVELHKRFNGEKFSVLGVNVWDEESKFKAALEEEGITYPQIFVPKDNADNATELYGIQGIPQIILFAPDGTIVKRDLRGEEMKAFVEAQLK